MTRKLTPYLFLSPILIGMLVLSVGPILISFIASFTQWDIVSPPQWVGAGNYKEIVSSDLFWQVLRNTFYYVALAVPLTIILSLFLAIAVNRKLKGIGLFRTVYFLPVVTSMVAVAIVWGWLYNPEYGLINYVLRSWFGVQGPAWLRDPNWAMPAMIIVGVWKALGYNMMIFLAGLQSVPDEYYEAARLDGANTRQRFFNITLPMLTPTIFFVLVVTLIGSFQVFEQTYILTRGGPANATLTISYFIFQNAFQFFRMGYASALAYVLFAIVFVLTLIQ
ncbi:MAG TPA: sugar ABC transporter permease, partial [Candidatus Kapabacteria bacterium]|nr:sugar ABC transporter permease [Candidatus Kapabacteria bacterium]